MKVQENGFTLLECLITIAILAIVSGVALSNFSSIITHQRLDNAMFRLYKALQFSRTYAVTNGFHTTFCPLVDGICQKQWQNTLYVFEDLNMNLSLDEGEAILKVIKPISSLDSLSYPRTAVTYRRDGSIRFMQSGSFLYCNEELYLSKGNRLTVSQVGRIRIRDSERCPNTNLHK